MAYFTQCTHCQTRFRITDAHLEAYNGQVRCGKCHQVFDARENLQPEQAPKPSKTIAPMPEPQPQKIADEAEHLQQVLASSRVPDKASELTSSTISEAHDRPSLPSDDDIERFDQGGFNLELPDFEAPKSPAEAKAAAQNLIQAMSAPQSKPALQTPTSTTATTAADKNTANIANEKTTAPSTADNIKPTTPAAAPETTPQPAAEAKASAVPVKDTPQPPPTETFDALIKQAPPERKPMDDATRQAFMNAMAAAQAELSKTSNEPAAAADAKMSAAAPSATPSKIAAYESTRDDTLNDDAPEQFSQNIAQSTENTEDHDNSKDRADTSFSARDEDDDVVLATRVHIDSPEDEDEDDEDDDDHGAQARKTLFFGIAIAASVLLFLQLTFLYRTEISAEVPGARAILESACQSLGCQVPLTQKGEFLRTEWSELTYVPDHPSLVQLSATLRNHAPYPMAFPFLELNLKDSDNHVIARKVFAPKDYLPEDRQALAAFHANSELKIIMPMELGTLKSAGYSLVWFYP